MTIFHVDDCLKLLFPPKTALPRTHQSILKIDSLTAVWLPIFYRRNGYTSQAMKLNGFLFLFQSYELNSKTSCCRVGAVLVSELVR